jgi:hypothetical protein
MLAICKGLRQTGLTGNGYPQSAAPAAGTSFWLLPTTATNLIRILIWRQETQSHRGAGLTVLGGADAE